jgi:hypothetical protein
MEKPNYPCIHYSELKPFTLPTGLDVEWNTYRSEVARLIAEGHEGEFVLIKGNEIAGFFPTFRDAHRYGLANFGVFAPYFIHQVQTYERIYKVGLLGSKGISGTERSTAQHSVIGPPLAKSA